MIIMISVRGCEVSLHSVYTGYIYAPIAAI